MTNPIRIPAILACAMALLALAPSFALAEGEAKSVRNTEGDVSAPRAEAQSALALRVRELFAAAKAGGDAAKLLEASRIMGRIEDRMDFSEEAPPPADMSARAASTRRPTGNVPVVLTRRDILSLASRLAQSGQNQSLIARVAAARQDLPKGGDGDPAGKCTWANCCGKWGCWTRCRWW